MNEDPYKATLTTVSVNSIVADLNNKDTQIKLDPPYQRDIVWDNLKYRNFIDSIYLNIIPQNIIFNLDATTGVRTSLDGKQRLTALHLFVGNHKSVYLTRDDERIYYSELPADIKNNKDNEDKNENKCRILTQIEKTQFINRNIPVVTYDNLTYEQQVNIFNRIQQGKALSPGELILVNMSDKNITITFKKYSDEKKNKLSPLIRTDREGHRPFIVTLMILIDNKNPCCITGKKISDFVEKLTEEQIKEKIKPINELIDIMFTEKILYHNRIKSIKKIQKNILQVTIYSIYNKFKNNLIKINDNCDIIVDTVETLMKIDFDGTMKEQTVKDIFSNFNSTYEACETKAKMKQNKLNNEPNDANNEIKQKKKVMVKKYVIIKKPIVTT